MGVAWGIERATTRYHSTEFFVEAWTRFCEADLCRHFAIPIDDTLHTFRRMDDGSVTVEAEPAPALIAQIRMMRCTDGTYDSFASLCLDEYSLFLPDNRGPRRIERGLLPWDYDMATGLRALFRLGTSGLPFELWAAGSFAEERRLIVSISF